MASKSTTKVSIVIPVFNNEESLEILVKELNIERAKWKTYKFEYIFIEDGSSDNSLKCLLNLKEEFPRLIKVVAFSRNFGQLAAMRAGYAQASGDLLISISADLQDPTTLVSEMLDLNNQGFEIVACNRLGRNDGMFSKVTSKLGYALLRNKVTNIPKGGFDVFLFTAKIKDQLLMLNGRFSFLQGDLLSLGFSIGFNGYYRQERPYGKSGYTFRKRFQNFADALLDTSYSAIQNAIKVGALFSLTGTFLAAVVIYGKLIGKDPFNGFSLLASAIFLIGGIQIVVLGLIGEYVWRIYDINRNKPQYVISSVN